MGTERVGNTVTLAGSVAVARQAVSEWLNRNAEFRTALNWRRLEIWGRLQDRPHSLLPKTVVLLERSLDPDGKD